MGREPGSGGSTYGVRLVRGPFVKLPAHRESTGNEEAFLTYCDRLRAEGTLLAADLFSGAGGLSLGLEAAGFRVVLSADHDPESVQTHRHHFGGLTLDWDLGDPGRVTEVARLVAASGVTLLAGGPPCQPFSKAGRYMIRHQVREGLRASHDARRDLWRSFLEVVLLARPPAVVMENVPDMALDREMFILRAMVHELESAGYAVEESVLNTWQYGVPQFRQRLLLVALRDGRGFEWPPEIPGRTSVREAIGDLPEVEGGWRPEGGADGWADYRTPRNNYQQRMRERIPPADEGKVFDHITRPVRPDDLKAFELMDTDTRYDELPEELKRYRDDIFYDKYKRLDEHDLSRTITAHIAKDGYWYIHPRESRTITVREAARLQTFPDRFRFAGPPSAAFRQIGNAVPPFLGEHLGAAVRRSLDDPQPAPASSQATAAALAGWFDSLDARVVPWLTAGSRWQVISGEILLDRLPAGQARHLWPLLVRWTTPGETVAAAEELREIARWTGRQHRAERLLAVGRHLCAFPEQLEDDEALRAVPGIFGSFADLAVLAVPTGRRDDRAEEPVLSGKGVLRVAARVSGGGGDLRNRLTDGRMAVARLIGYGGDARRAHLGLIELAAGLCRPSGPRCDRCPLRDLCAYAGAA